MFGSDWPVCRLAGAEHNQANILYFQDFKYILISIFQCTFVRLNFYESYPQVVQNLNDVLQLCGLSDEEKKKIFRENALQIYSIQI